jgi:Ca-activated chloride channel family protein
MFQFAHFKILYLTGLIPFIILFYWLLTKRKNKLLKDFGDREIIQELIPEHSDIRLTVKLIVFLLALVFLIFGLAGPEFGSKLQKTKRNGCEIIIALDVSNSMMAQDILPNRLEKAKQAISKLVDKLGENKIGLIVFAGEPFVQLPITTDYVSAKMFLSTISTKIVAVQGTAIGSAINLAAKSFSPNTTADKAIIVITDGENHEDDAITAAKAAQDNGIHVNTIGVGLPEGAPIPIDDGSQHNFIKDEHGSVVISKLDEQLLQEIAAVGKGAYIRANNSELGLNTIYKEINKMSRSEIESKTYSEFENQFQWPLGIGVLLLVMELLILERKTKWSTKWNLFQIIK